MATIEEKIAKELKRKEVEIKVCNDYRELQGKYPDESISCITETLASQYLKIKLKTGIKQYPVTAMGIRNILIRNGLYTPQKDRNNENAAI